MKPYTYVNQQSYDEKQPDGTIKRRFFIGYRTFRGRYCEQKQRFDSIKKAAEALSIEIL